MKHYLYLIRNKINGKIYIGAHSTCNMDDKYMGSGTALKAAIKKYGLEQFEKTILGFFPTAEEMFAGEAELVDVDFVTRADVYNLVEGGRGFSTYASGLANERRQWLLDNDEDFRRRYSQALVEASPGLTKEAGALMLERKRKLKVGCCHNPETRLEMSRRAQSPEAQRKRRATWEDIKHQQGETNSQYGTMWITDGKLNKSIKRGESFPKGWYKGRTMKMKGDMPIG